MIEPYLLTFKIKKAYITQKKNFIDKNQSKLEKSKLQLSQDIFTNQKAKHLNRLYQNGIPWK